MSDVANLLTALERRLKTARAAGQDIRAEYGLGVTTFGREDEPYRRAVFDGRILIRVEIGPFDSAELTRRLGPSPLEVRREALGGAS